MTNLHRDQDLADRKSPERLLSIVLPIYNERRALEALIAGITSAAEQTEMRYEIIFVNDGSADGSGELLDRYALRHPQAKVVHLSRNFGHQAAVQAGLAHAQGDCLVLMDSDLQDAPTAIPRFVEQWKAGYDVVYAIRTDRKEHRLKRLMFSAFYRMLNRISHTQLPLDAGNFGLIDRRVAKQITSMAERDRYYAGLRGWVGFRQTGIPVERMARYDKQPRVSLLGLIRLAKTAIFSFSTFPLAIFGVIGTLAMSIFLALAGFSIFCKLFTELAIPGWTSHILSASFFGALNAFGISILGEYVIRIYDQVRARPLYVVENVTEQMVPATAVESAPSRQAVAEEEDLYLDMLEDMNQLLLEAMQFRDRLMEAPEDTASTTPAEPLAANGR